MFGGTQGYPGLAAPMLRTGGGAPTQKEGGALVGHGKGALEGDADATEGAFFEEAADQRDCRGAPGAGEKILGEDFLGRGAQSERASETSTKSGAESERRMAGVIADGEHFVAQGRNEEEIHLGEDAGHFFGDFAAEAIGLDEIHGGQEARLAENDSARRRRSGP